MKHLSKYVSGTRYDKLYHCNRGILSYFIYDDVSLSVIHLDGSITPLGIPNEENSKSTGGGSSFTFALYYDIYFPNGYAVFTKWEKYGLINDSGSIILAPIYRDIRCFKNGLAVVEGDDYRYGVIDSAGSIIIPLQYESIERVEEEEYSFIAKSESTCDYLNNKGSLIKRYYFPTIYEDNGLFGIRGGDTKGVLIPAVYDSITRLDHSYWGGIMAFIVSKDNKYGIASPQGKLVGDCCYDSIYKTNGSGRICFKIDDRTGVFEGGLEPRYDNKYGLYELFDDNGNKGIRLFETKAVTVPATEGVDISYFVGDYFLLTKVDPQNSYSEIYGVVRGDGTRITPFNGKHIDRYTTGNIVYFPRGKGEKRYGKPILFNSVGDALVDSKYDDITIDNRYNCIKSPLYNKYFYVSVESEGSTKRGIIDIEGREIIPPVYSRINLLSAIQGFLLDSTIILNSDFKTIGKLPQKACSIYDCDDLVIPFGERKDNNNALLSPQNGLVVLPSGFQRIRYAGSDRFVVYDKIKGYGYIDGTGKIVIPLRYNEVSSFIDGRARVRLDTEYAFVNPDGNLLLNEAVVLPLDYEWGWLEDNGIIVMKNGKFGYLDRNCNTLIPPINDSKYDIMQALNAIRGIKEDEHVHPFIDDVSGLFGFISEAGKVLVPAIYEEILGLHKRDKYHEITNPIHFSLGSLNAVKYNSLWGFVNDKGEVKIPFNFSKVGFFQSGLAAVKIHPDYWRQYNSQQGFINEQGEIVINVDIKYEIINGFGSDGRATIEINPCVPGKDNYYQDINKRGEYVD